MSGFSPLSGVTGKLQHVADLLRRKPTGINATLPWGLAQRLQHRADKRAGRSAA